jgi:tripartite-type tricarboxylate transporter receptor subunit TctC
MSTRCEAVMKVERKMRFLRAALMVCLGIAGLVDTAPAQEYPARPVRIVAPFAPGGGTDFIARLIAQKLTERLGQQVLVDNRPGAGGNIGAELAIRAAPDGYTMLLVAGSYAVNPSLYKLSFDPVRDITAIIQLSQGPFVVAVNPSVKANTLKEFIALAKNEPDRFAYASAGSGSITHLASELFLESAKIKMTHVPYKGTGPALADTMAGNVQLIFGSVATTLQHIKSGRLRGLAVTTPRRIGGAPELPTMAEAGVTGYEVVVWHGLVGPKGIPQPIVERLNREANQALRVPDMESLLGTDGVSPAGGSPEQFLSTIKLDIDRWARVVKQAGVRLD